MGGFANSLLTVLLSWFRNLIAGVWSWAVDGRENFFTWLGENWFTLFLGISLVCTAIEILLRIRRRRAYAPADKRSRPEREAPLSPEPETEETEETELQTRVMAPVEAEPAAEENPYRATRRRRSDRYAAQAGTDWKGKTLE